MSHKRCAEKVRGDAYAIAFMNITKPLMDKVADLEKEMDEMASKLKRLKIHKCPGCNSWEYWTEVRESLACGDEGTVICGRHPLSSGATLCFQIHGRTTHICPKCGYEHRGRSV